MITEKNTHHHNNSHVPVLLDEVVALLAPQQGESYLDLTAGYGGHASAIGERTGAFEHMTLVDRDQEAINALSPLAEQGARIMHCDFLSAATELVAQRQQFDMVLADLGVSSVQLDQGQRGFSFRADAPLDMRMDTRQAHPPSRC